MAENVQHGAPPAPGPEAQTVEAEKRKRAPRGEGNSIYVLCYTDGTYVEVARDKLAETVQSVPKDKTVKYLVRGEPARPHVETVVRMGFTARRKGK